MIKKLLFTIAVLISALVFSGCDGEQVDVSQEEIDLGFIDGTDVRLGELQDKIKELQGELNATKEKMSEVSDELNATQEENQELTKDLTACKSENDECRALKGIFNTITERIDTSNIVLNHYIDGQLIDSNFADVFTAEDGHEYTVNNIVMPEYKGEPMRHVLIIEFYQTQ